MKNHNDIYDEDYEEGRCIICNDMLEDDSRLTIDLDFDTDLPRGNICDNCYIGINHMKNSPELLRRSSEYCEYWRDVNTLDD